MSSWVRVVVLLKGSGEVVPCRDERFHSAAKPRQKKSKDLIANTVKEGEDG